MNTSIAVVLLKYYDKNRQLQSPRASWIIIAPLPLEATVMKSYTKLSWLSKMFVKQWTSTVNMWMLATTKLL